MSNDPMYAITLAAANLKIAAPEQFDALVAAFKQLEDRYRNDMLSASEGSLIFNAQGRTWLATMLVARLANCLELRRGYENRA
jgi:hypothetical protein